MQSRPHLELNDAEQLAADIDFPLPVKLKISSYLVQVIDTALAGLAGCQQIPGELVERAGKPLFRWHGKAHFIDTSTHGFRDPLPHRLSQDEFIQGTANFPLRRYAERQGDQTVTQDIGDLLAVALQFPDSEWPAALGRPTELFGQSL